MEYKKASKLKILLKLQLLISFLSIINQNIYPAAKIRISRFANAKDGYEQIMSAIRNNNKAKLKKLIKQEGNLFHAVSALMRLADNGDKKAVQLLIEAGIESGLDINAVDQDGYTALMWASESGRKEIVKFLIAKKANVNIASTRNGSTALIATIRNGHKEIAELLIDAKADVNIASKVGHTALIEATYIGNTEIVKLLINNGADVNIAGIDGYTALIEATMKGYKDIVELLLKAEADIERVDCNIMKAIDHARSINPADSIQTRTNKAEICRMLADVKIRINLDKLKLASPELAIKAEIVEQLLSDSFEDKKETGEAAAQVKGSQSSTSCSSKDLDLKLRESLESLKKSHELIKKEADHLVWLRNNNKTVPMGNSPVLTQLYVGIDMADSELVKKSLEQNPDVNCKIQVLSPDNSLCKMYPIFLALPGKIEIIKLLIEAGADVNIVDDQTGLRPISLAAESGCSVEKINLLIRAGATVNVSAKDGFTPLHFAANAEIVNALLKAGANIEAQSENLLTPLHQAIQDDRLSAASALIDSGANITAQTKQGTPPLGFASARARPGIAADILEFGIELTLSQEVAVSSILNIKGKSGDLIRNIIFKKISIIEALLKMRRITEADINWQDKSGMSAIMWAVVRCPELVTKLLIYCKENGLHADLSLVNCNGQTALSLAVKHSKWDIVDVIERYLYGRKEFISNLLTSNGLSTKINDLVTSYLFGQSSPENLLNTKKMIDHSANIKHPLSSAHEHKGPEHSALSSQLTSAQSFGEVVGSRAVEIPSSLLLSEKGDIKAIGNSKKEGKSASLDSELYKATVMGNKKKVEFLIQCGTNVNVYSPTIGYTPLMAASMFGYEDIVQLLIPARADVNAVNYIAGDTALNLAVMSGHGKIVKLLINAKANVNAGLKDGTTPLMNAARSGYKNIAKLLLIAGADINKVNVDKMKAIDFAQLVEGYSETVQKNKAVIAKLLNLENEYAVL